MIQMACLDGFQLSPHDAIPSGPVTGLGDGAWEAIQEQCGLLQEAKQRSRQDKTRQRLLEAKQRSRGQDQSLAWKMEREKQSRSNVGCYRRPSRGQDKTRQDKGYWRPSRGQEVRTSHWPGRWSVRSNPGAMWAATGGQAEVKTRQDKGYTGGQAEIKTRQDKTRQRLPEDKQRSKQDKTRQRLLEAKQRSRGQDQSLAWEMEREKQSRSNVGCIGWTKAPGGEQHVSSAIRDREHGDCSSWYKRLHWLNKLLEATQRPRQDKS